MQGNIWIQWLWGSYLTCTIVLLWKHGGREVTLELIWSEETCSFCVNTVLRRFELSLTSLLKGEGGGGGRPLAVSRICLCGFAFAHNFLRFWLWPIHSPYFGMDVTFFIMTKTCTKVHVRWEKNWPLILLNVYLLYLVDNNCEWKVSFFLWNKLLCATQYNLDSWFFCSKTHDVTLFCWSIFFWVVFSIFQVAFIKKRFLWSSKMNSTALTF